MEKPRRGSIPGYNLGRKTGQGFHFSQAQGFPQGRKKKTKLLNM